MTRSHTDAGAFDHVLTRVMNLPLEHPIRNALTFYQAVTITDVMILTEEDYAQPYTYPDPDHMDQELTKTLTIMDQRNMKLLKTWYSQQAMDPSTFKPWYDLTAETFTAFKLQMSNLSQTQPTVSNTTSGATIVTHGAPMITPNFQNGVKITLSDYPKLKEDKQWRSYQRLLKACAAAHDTTDVLVPTFTPDPTNRAAVNAFEQKKRFMYNVFTQCITTSKGRICVRQNLDTVDGQKVYTDLLGVYDDNLSAQLAATQLRAELTILKLDDKWRTGYEQFLNHWLNKVLELEFIEDTVVDDNTRRIWLTNSLLGHPEMTSAIRQATTTELTIVGLATGSTTAQVSWSNFFNILMSTAKMLDTTKRDQSKTQRFIQQNEQQRKLSPNGGKPWSMGGRLHNGSSPNTQPGNNKGQYTQKTNSGQNSNNTREYTKFTGPSMQMHHSYVFSKSDWNKMTISQRDKLKELKIKERATSNQTHANTQTNRQTRVNSTIISPSSVAQTALSTIPTPTITTPVIQTQPNNAVRQVLSVSASRPPANVTPTPIPINTRTISIKACNISYRINHIDQKDSSGSLIDGGANGGMSGSDVRLIEYTMNSADITGIGNQVIHDIPIATVAGLLQSQKGPIIGIFHQYAHYGKGRTVHSVNQLRDFGIIVNDTPRTYTMSGQTILTPEGFIIPLSIRNGLPHLDMIPPSETELDCYPHVFMTSDAPWVPQTLDNEYNIDNLDIHEDTDTNPSYHPGTLNDFGEIIQYQSNNIMVSHQDHIDELLDKIHPASNGSQIQRTIIQPKQHDFVRLQPNFGFAPPDRIKYTLDNTTQFARMDVRLPLRKHYKSRFPAANVSRLNETFATDTFFSDTPALDDGILGHGGSTMIQVFCGCTSQLIAGYPMNSESQIASTLEDLIRSYGAPNALFSDNAKAQIGSAVKEILRMYAIKDLQSEPYHQHQNYAERRIQEIKKMSNNLMDRTATPPECWLLCAQYTIYILNRLASRTLNWKTPLETATGRQPDVSALLAFRWYEPVYYMSPDTTSYPTRNRERTGRIVGIAEHIGDAMTFLILDDNTRRTLARSELRSALNPLTPNLRAESNTTNTFIESNEDAYNKPIKSVADAAGVNEELPGFRLPKFSPDELIGKIFTRTDEDGNTHRATVLRKINDIDAYNKNQIKLLCQVGDADYDEIIAYNEVSHLIEDQEQQDPHDPDKLWTFREILDHHGPLKQNHPDYKGSAYNVLVKWDTGEETWEPLELMIKFDPITLVNYAEAHLLLAKPGWKRLKRHLKRRKSQSFHVQATKRTKHTHKTSPIYQFGVQVPRSVREAHDLDKSNGNTKWHDAMQEELKSLHDYDTFKDYGNKTYLPDHKRIIVKFVFAVKHDLRHKARLVAGGHLTDPTTEGSYSGVISLRTLRLAIFAGELNHLNIMAGDISSAYLEAHTKERVYIIAGPEFGPLAGHLLVVSKALYGLRTSGARWHDRFADTLRDMGFIQCKADPDLWLKDCLTHYEYVCVYVDDIMMIGKDPGAFFTALTDEYHYQLKGVGPPTYHLGGDFYRDPDGTLAWGAKSYVQKMISNYEIMFGAKPKESGIPMQSQDHPELDLTELLDDKGIKQYQSLIGALQWLVTLGRFDILIGVATMGSYRVAPRIGHLERLQKMFGYIKRNPDGAIRFRTNIPDHESYNQIQHYDWSSTVYGHGSEEIPSDMPIPRGHEVRTTTYHDANLLHDLATGRSMTGILHLVNQTPIQWFSKKQNIVETATYGSEFMAARQATEQIMDLRYTIRMMGIPLDGPSWLFGDNQGVITSGTIPHSTLNKRHNALSYHRVREAIAFGIMFMLHVAGKYNPSDLFTKFLTHTRLFPLVRPLLFWRGDTQHPQQQHLPLPTQIEALETAQVDDPSGSRGVTDDINKDNNNITQNSNINQQYQHTSENVEPYMITITPEKNKSNILYSTQVDLSNTADDLYTTTGDTVHTVDNLNTTDMDIDTSYMSYDTSPSYGTSTTEQYYSATYCTTPTVTPKRVSFRDALVNGTSNAPVSIKQNTSTNMRNLQVISSVNQDLSVKSTKTSRNNADPQEDIPDPQTNHLIDTIDSTRTIESKGLLKRNIQENEVKQSTAKFDIMIPENNNQHQMKIQSSLDI